MKRVFASCVTLALLGACQPEVEPGTKDTDITQSITQDTTWRAGNVYHLKGYIFVEGGTLTIEPGTTIQGDQGSALVVTRNARLHAVGTSDKPIVFTSSVAPGERAAGDWGGVVLLGKASINVTGGENTIEGFFADKDERTKYGGTDDTHDCGKLKYVRIEFAGYELAEDNELNGLTLGACGSKTEVDFVQVHLGADDGVELFGGTANLRHLLITQPDDDGLDYDLGYRGKVQFLVVQQNGTVGNRAVEASGNKSAQAAEPRSTPEIWNATFIGSNREPGKQPSQEGLVFNTGAGGKVYNTVVAYFSDKAVDVDGTASATLYTQAQPGLSLRTSFFWDNKNDTTSIPYAPNPKKDPATNAVIEAETTKYTDASGTSVPFVEPEQVLAAATRNQVVDPLLTAPLDLKAPDFAPRAGSPALNQENASPPPADADGFLDTQATFVGAVGLTNWLDGWTAFPEN